MQTVKKQTLAVSAGVHATQDGLTSTVYVLLPILAQSLGLSYAQVGTVRAVYSGMMWDLDQGHYPFLAGQPEPDFFLGDYSALRCNYLPHDYRKDSSGHNIIATVHCEAERERTDQVGETLWLEQIAGAHSMPAAIVAHAWFDTPDAEDIIAQQAERLMVRGIRSKPRTGNAPGTISPDAPGTMGDPLWRRGLRLLEKYDLSYDLRVPVWHLKEAVEIARLIPQTTGQ